MASTSLRSAHGFDISREGMGLSSVTGWASDNGICPAARSRRQGAMMANWDCDSGGLKINSNGYVANTSTNWSSGSEDRGYSRWYLYVEQYPAAASGDGEIVIQEWTSTTGIYFASVTLDSVGTIRIRHHDSGGNKSLIGESVAGVIPLDQWVCVETTCKFNTITTQAPPDPPYQTNAYFAVRVDGVTVAEYDIAGGDPAGGTVNYSWGLNCYWAYLSSVRTGAMADVYNYYGTSVQGWKLYVDDLAFAEDDWIGSGVVCGVSPVSLKSAGWGLTASNCEVMFKEYASQTSSTYCQSNTALDEVDFQLPTLRSLGITSTTRYAEFAVQFAQYNPVDVFIQVNGGAKTYYTTYYYSGSGSYMGTVKVPGLALEPDDDVVIGLRKKNTSDLVKIARLTLVVEAVNVELVSSPSPDVKIAIGTYTGNGTQQEIDVGFSPDCIIVSYAGSSTGGSQRMCIYSRGRHGHPLPPWDAFVGPGSNYAESIIRFTDKGFVVAGSGSDTLNTNATTYGVVAMQDPSHRILSRQMYSVYGAVAEPNIAHWLNTTFEADAILSTQFRSDMLGNGSCGTWTGPGNGTNRATNFQLASANDSLNVILNNTVGQFEYGTSSRTGVSDTCTAVIGFAENAMNTTLLKVFTYAGIGTAQATVSLPVDIAGKTPAAIWILPGTGESGTYANYVYKGPGMSGNLAMRCSQNGLEDTLIGPFTVGSFDVFGATSLNRSGCTYTVIVLLEGDDAIPRYALVIDDLPPTPLIEDDWGPGWGEWGADWSYTRDEWMFSWPDDVPGLLGVFFGLRRYNAPGDPVRAYKVACEQRTFPIEAETREIDVPCEQRTFDALQEYP